MPPTSSSNAAKRQAAKPRRAPNAPRRNRGKETTKHTKALQQLQFSKAETTQRPLCAQRGKNITPLSRNLSQRSFRAGSCHALNPALPKQIPSARMAQEQPKQLPSCTERPCVRAGALRAGRLSQHHHQHLQLTCSSDSSQGEI